MSFGIPSRTARTVFVCLLLLLAIVAMVKLGSPVAKEAKPQTAPAARPLFVDKKCADLVVLGLRGSGQSPTKNAGVGAEVFKSVKNMVTRLHADSTTTVRLEAVTFRATRAETLAKYLDGVRDGQRRLGLQYANDSKRCKDSKFAIIGFSQGAQVAHEFSFDLPASRTHNLVLIAMIADPRKNPADSIAAWSYTAKPTTAQGKLGAAPTFAAGLRHIAISFCVEADEVCNRPSAGGLETMSTTHRRFYEKAGTVRSTGEQLNAILHRNGVG